MKRNISLLLHVIAAALQLGCQRLDDDPKEWDIELERGYSENNDDALLAFLGDWHTNSVPVSTELLARKPEFERAVYQIYEAFFRPAEFYKDEKYVVIQEKVSVYILDSDLQGLPEAEPWDWPDIARNLPLISHLEIRQFRPAVSFAEKKILYLQDAYLAPMLALLTQDNGYAMLDRYWDEDCVSDERKRRLEYLNSQLEIIPGHWETGWHFQTHPQIDAVFVAADFKRALVSYREHYGGGEAIMKATKNGKWEIVVKEPTWVE